MLLGSDHETTNETTAICRQQLHKYATAPEPSLGNVWTQQWKSVERVFSMQSVQRVYPKEQLWLWEDLLWLRHADSSGTQRKWNCRCKTGEDSD